MISSDWQSQIFEKKKKKKIGDPNLGQKAENRARNQFLCRFLKFGLLVFLEIAQDDSLEQFLTSSRGKTHKTNFVGPHLGQTDQKNTPPKIFLSFFQVWFIYIAQDNSLKHCLTTSRGKTRKKNFGAQIQTQNQVFLTFS